MKVAEGLKCLTRGYPAVVVVVVAVDPSAAAVGADRPAAVDLALVDPSARVSGPRRSRRIRRSLLGLLWKGYVCRWYSHINLF